ncbi:hypothetical protein GWK47_043513 [Chionoecetes opilio]|uniref:Uncharacterized protein n=1 Tax=Chionoecetes opilio TaxID=41210 RepID=A0A8J5CW42_CHIOP|nr:hypothetical protein GWK47_043513 [Chionoecetes opilio]
MKKAKEEVKREGVAVLKVPAKKLPLSPCARHGGPLGEKRDTRGENNQKHVESHQRPGEPGSGPGLRKGPPVLHWWYPSPTWQGPGRPIQGNRSWPPERNPPWHLIPSTHGKPSLTKLGSPVRRKSIESGPEETAGCFEGAFRREKGIRGKEGLLSPVPPGTPPIRERARSRLQTTDGKKPPRQKVSQATRWGSGPGKQDRGRRRESQGIPRSGGKGKAPRRHPRRKGGRKGPRGQEARGREIPEPSRLGTGRAHPFPLGAHQGESSSTPQIKEAPGGEEAGVGTRESRSRRMGPRI